MESLRKFHCYFSMTSFSKPPRFSLLFSGNSQKATRNRWKISSLEKFSEESRYMVGGKLRKIHGSEDKLYRYTVFISLLDSDRPGSNADPVDLDWISYFACHDAR